jgi:hypothetical protein
MEQAIIEDIFKAVGKNRPAAIPSLFQRAGGIDNFKTLERFFRTSKKLGMDDFQKTVVSPLRHRFLSLVFDENTGRFTGASLDRAIKTSIKGNGPKYLDELFGANARVGLQEAANTLKLMESTQESNIVIKIIQAGVLMGGAGVLAAGEATDSNTLQQLGMGAVAVGLLPWAAARIMANPRLIRTLTDGMVAGPGTSKFARAIMVATVQNRDALKEMAKLSPEAQEFYDNPYKDGSEPEATQAASPTLGTVGGTAGQFFPDQPLTPQ